MFTKKGQSALEFLTTYGWAFLVALIMIGALAYFGVLNPSRYLPERCNFGSEVTCSDFILDASGEDRVILRLTNNIGETVRVGEVNLTTPDGFNIPCDWDEQVAAGYPEFNYTWRDGETHNFEFNTQACELEDNGIVPGTKSKVVVELTYWAAKSSPEFEHTINGEVYAQVN
ncbi:MAG: hypothetical protein ACLFPQ_06660 [Candidatus Woesearchaeota archaeon]